MVPDDNLRVTVIDVILNYSFACRDETLVQRRVRRRPELERIPSYSKICLDSDSSLDKRGLPKFHIRFRSTSRRIRRGSSEPERGPFIRNYNKLGAAMSSQRSKSPNGNSSRQLDSP
jgi:hypothetical protein